MRTPLTRLLLTLTTAATLTACSGEAPPATDDPGTAGGTVIEIAIAGDSTDPHGERVEVPLGEPLTLAITADRAGELHVHSSPEQEVEFEEGETRVELTFDKPGVVDVEDHESGDVIVQLQVS